MEIPEIYATLLSAAVALGLATMKEDMAQTILCKALAAGKRTGGTLESYHRTYWLAAVRNYARSEWRTKGRHAGVGFATASLTNILDLYLVDSLNLEVQAEIEEVLRQVPQRMWAIILAQATPTNCERVYMCRERKKLRQWVAA